MTSVTEFSTAFIIVIIILIVFSLSYNGLILIVVLKRKDFRNTVDIFLCNLVVSDIIYAGLATPLILSQASSSEDFIGGKIVYMYLQCVYIQPLFFMF